MRCERQKSQTTESVGSPAWWRRCRCPECRRAHGADALTERAVAQMRNEPPPVDSLAKTLAAVGCSAAALSAENRRATRTALARALLLVGTGIFVTTLVQPENIGRSLFGAPQSHASVQGIAGFWALLSLFWYLKPLAALLLQSAPWLISRRGQCLLASALGAAILWLLPSLVLNIPPALNTTLGICINAMLALASTILGGYLVEQAQHIGASGRLGALHQAAAHLGAMVAPLLGLTAGRILAPSTAAILLVLFGVLAAVLMPRESPALAADRRAGIMEQMQALGNARELWKVAIMLLLVMGAPSFDALLARQQVARGFSLEQRQHLNSIAHAATLISILAYAVLCRRVRLQSLLPAGILANAGGTLLYLVYAGPVNFAVATTVEIVNGLAAALIVVTLFDLAVRAVPRQCAYLGYAILMSVSNLAHSLSEVATASLPLGFASVTLLSAVLSALALLLVTRLPSALMARREGEMPPAATPLFSRT